MSDKSNLDETYIAMMNSVHHYYESAFSSLQETMLFFVGLIIGIVGVAIPIFQNWKIDKTKKDLISHANDEIRKEVVELKNEFESVLNGKYKYLDEKYEKLKTGIDKSNNESMGSIFHLQANSELGEKNSLCSVKSFAAAGCYYIGAKNHVDLIKMINGVCEGLPDANENDFKDEPTAEPNIIKLITLLSADEFKEKYASEVKGIKEELEKAKSRRSEDNEKEDD